ncbi:MAG: hypothetical protein ACTHJ3_10945 [Pararhizobium sp.]
MRNTIFRTAFERVVAAREKQVRRAVNAHLLTLDDKTLRDMGRSREELRREGQSSFVF